MLPRLFHAFSLVTTILLLSRCSSPPIRQPKPKVKSCLLIPARGVLDCFNPFLTPESRKYPIALSGARGYTCFDPDGLQQILTYIELED